MIKEFKLIKKYPGSPKLGTVINNDSGFIDAVKPQEYSEFWEEVFLEKTKEKDYEILSYKFHTGEIYKKTNISTFVCRGISSYPQAIEEKLFDSTYKNEVDIQSVRRLSDNVVFSTEDVIDGRTVLNKKILSIKISKANGLVFETGIYQDVTLENAIKNKYYIKTESGFRVYEGNSCWFVDKNGFINRYLVHSNSSDIQGELKFFYTEKEARDYSEVHFPKYLMTTEDHVKIVKNQIVFLVNKNTFEINSYAVTTNINPILGANFAFSTKQRAEEYAKIHKPLFTTQDGVKIYYGQVYVSVSKNKFKISEDNFAKSDPSSYLSDGLVGSNFYLFKSLQKAERFRKESLLFDKKCLSIDDIANIYVTANRKDNNGNYTEQAIKLHNLVESRL